MVKKAYKVLKKGDFYVLPAGYTKSGYHTEIKVMDKERANEIMRARKTMTLKRKYPEIRQGVAGQKVQQKPPKESKVDWKMQELKEIPDYINGGKYLFKLQGLPSTKQVATANENYYKYHGNETVVLKTRDGKYALYVSEKGGK